ncbi:hypothetical protein MXB_543, partial [Myxobolus squamalis]
GLSEFVYKYCIARGLSTSINYPYTANESLCQQNNPNSSFEISDYKLLYKGDKFNLLAAIYKVGPISISMDAIPYEFLFYQSGILEIPGCSCVNLNHEVLAVDYNLYEPQYLLAKNRLHYIETIC